MGYSAYSALPSMYADQAVQATWEGDNTILMLFSIVSSAAHVQHAFKAAEVACVSFKLSRTALVSVLDYPTHQRRLLPLLAQAVAMGFTSYQVTAMYEAMTGLALTSASPDLNCRRTAAYRIAIVKAFFATSAESATPADPPSSKRSCSTTRPTSAACFRCWRRPSRWASPELPLGLGWRSPLHRRT
jgi:hypothetical protein